MFLVIAPATPGSTTSVSRISMALIDRPLPPASPVIPVSPQSSIQAINIRASAGVHYLVAQERPPSREILLNDLLSLMASMPLCGPATL